MTKIFILFLLILSMSGCSLFNSPNPVKMDTTDTPEFKPLSSGVQTIQGVVLGGGDQTPEGLLDAPRQFIYQVKLDSGEEINVTYTAYPPSPAGDSMPHPKLTIHAGEILFGDSITARGTFDAETRTLVVELDSDFIETNPRD